jgi:hypothetical protein
VSLATAPPPPSRRAMRCAIPPPGRIPFVAPGAHAASRGAPAISRHTPTHVQPHPHADPFHACLRISVSAHSLLPPPHSPCALPQSASATHTEPALSHPLTCPHRIAHVLCCCRFASRAAHSARTAPPRSQLHSWVMEMGMGRGWGACGCICSLLSDASPGVAPARWRSDRAATGRDDPTAPPPLRTASCRCGSPFYVASQSPAVTYLAGLRACLAARTRLPCVGCRMM